MAGAFSKLHISNAILPLSPVAAPAYRSSSVSALVGGGSARISDSGPHEA